MRHPVVIIAAIGACLLAAPRAFAQVQVTMQNGRVSIAAKDATLRQIMTEWARVGETKVVNVEKIPGGPMTIQLNNVPEEQALATLMRPLSGYVAATRANGGPNQSRFDRILVMPTVAAARTPTTTTAASAPAAPATPVFQAAMPASLPNPAEDDDDSTGAEQRAGQRGPIFTTFPQPQIVNPNMPAAAVPVQVVPNPANQQQQQPQQQPQQQQQQAAPPAPAGFPTVPAGVAVPGMLVPAPQPSTPGAPRRPGGA